MPLMMIIIMTMMMLMVVVVVPSSGLQGFSQRAHPRSLRDLRVIEQSGTPIGGCSIGFTIQGFNDGRNAVLTGWTEVRVSSPYRKRQDAKPASRASKIQLRHSVTWCSARRCRMKWTLAVDGFVAWNEISNRSKLGARDRIVHSELLRAPSLFDRISEEATLVT